LINKKNVDVRKEFESQIIKITTDEKSKMESKISQKEICQITGVPNLTVGRDLKSLREENFILKVEPTKTPRIHFFILKENSN
jgi:Fic family protein